MDERILSFRTCKTKQYYVLFMDMYLCSKSIKKCMKMINTEFKVVVISKEEGR